MAIPESQLETWANQGSIQQSSTTYQLIRNVLMTKGTGFSGHSFEVFLQGSYGNDTNIYSESDVDIVIRLDSTFRFDTTKLSASNRLVYNSCFVPATYAIDQFKNDVIKCLSSNFGTVDVSSGNKAIKIQGTKGRRNADVVVCQEFRKYNSFETVDSEDYLSGIAFPTLTGEIINFPKQHSDFLTKKNQDTSGMLKPMIRILKNMRSRMVSNGTLKSGIAPSYYIEGLIYNVPSDQYDPSSYTNTFCNCINWLLKCNKAELVCPNWQYYLFGESNVQWKTVDCESFLAGVCQLWNNWQKS